MKTYIVVEIIEPDFGCEGLPEGKERMDEMIIADEKSGEKITVSVADAELYAKDIYEGDKIEYINNEIRKINL